MHYCSKPGRDLLIKLLLKKDGLSAAERDEIADFNEKFNAFEDVMGKIRDKGLLLEHDEKSSK